MAYKLNTIFLCYEQARYPTDAKYSFSSPELNLFISRKSVVSQALLLRNVDKISHLSLSVFYGSMAVFIPKTYYSSKRTLASNSVCEYFMLLRTIKVVHLDA